MSRNLWNIVNECLIFLGELLCWQTLWRRLISLDFGTLRHSEQVSVSFAVDLAKSPMSCSCFRDIVCGRELCSVCTSYFQLKIRMLKSLFPFTNRDLFLYNDAIITCYMYCNVSFSTHYYSWDLIHLVILLFTAHRFLYFHISLSSYFLFLLFFANIIFSWEIFSGRRIRVRLPRL